VIAVTDPQHDAVVRGVLAHATARQLGIKADALPKIPVDLPGARVLGRLGRLWTTFLVGHRWRKGSVDRLYGWRANPTDGVAELGYIDLSSGRLHPIHENPLGKDLGAPERYLLRLRENWPSAPSR
jgi:hypothetical protein